MRKYVLKSLFLACALMGAQAYAEEPSSAQVTQAQEQTYELTFLHAESFTFIPIDLSSNLIFVRVELKGREVWALVDNGSEATLIDSGLANELHISLNEVSDPITTGFGQMRAYRASSAQLEVPRQFQASGNFLSADLSVVSSAIGKDIGVILGGDILDKISYVIDARGNRMLFMISGSLNFDSPSLIEIPVSHGTIEGNVNGIRADLRIDLGSTTALRVPEPRWDYFFPNGNLVDLGRSIDGAGIIARNQGVQDIVLEVSQITSVFDVEMNRELSRNADGYVGLPFFRDKLTLFDYPGGKVVVLAR